MGYDGEISIRERIDHFVKDGKHPVNLLPDEETMKDIFIELEDDKEFKIVVANDMQTSVESDEVIYYEMATNKNYKWKENTQFDFEPLYMTTIKKRANIIKQTKSIMIIPSQE